MQPDEQPELFRIPEQPMTRCRKIHPIGTLQIRQDHAVLLAIAGLIAVSVVFALGVERGKLIARSMQQSTCSSVIASDVPLDQDGAKAMTQPGVSVSVVPEMQKASGPVTAVPGPKLFVPSVENTGTVAPAKPKAPTKAVANRSRFAVQVVTYSQERLARKELDRLKQRGEQAFLMTKRNRVVLCVGPFSTREHATAKLASLKQHYQDCFLRTL